MKRIYEIAVLASGGYARTLRIYSPKKADRAVIMHDGQNVFCDAEAAYGMSWRAADTLKRLGIKNTAIIGIDSVSTRMTDYLPFPAENGLPEVGGKANDYAEYISHMVIPYLLKRGFKAFAMLGSSAGALATLYYAAKRDCRIKAYGMFSTPLFVSPRAFDEFFSSAEFDRDALYRVYAGGAEKTEVENAPQLYTDDAFKLVNALRRGGARDIKLYFDNRGEHNEICWRKSEAEFFADFSALEL